MSTWPQRRGRRIHGARVNKLHRPYAAAHGRDKRVLRCELTACERVPKRNAACPKILEHRPSGLNLPATDRSSECQSPQVPHSIEPHILKINWLVVNSTGRRGNPVGELAWLDDLSH